MNIQVKYIKRNQPKIILNALGGSLSSSASSLSTMFYPAIPESALSHLKAPIMRIFNVPLHEATFPISKPSIVTLTTSHETSVVFFSVGMPCDVVAPQTDPTLLATDRELLLMAFQLVAIGKPLQTDGALFAFEICPG